MNEITIHGNVTAAATVHRTSETGRVVAAFTVAVNSGWYDKPSGQYKSRPTVFHQVICYRDLAENVAVSLAKGTAVTVTGKLADDSYTPPGWDKPLRRMRLEAEDVAVSLRRATAVVTRHTAADQAAERAAEAGGLVEQDRTRDFAETAVA